MKQLGFATSQFGCCSNVATADPLAKMSSPLANHRAFTVLEEIEVRKLAAEVPAVDGFQLPEMEPNSVPFCMSLFWSRISIDPTTYPWKVPLRLKREISVAIVTVTDAPSNHSAPAAWTVPWVLSP